MYCGIDITNSNNYTCDNKPFIANNNIIPERDLLYETNSDSLIKCAKDYNKIKHQTENNLILNRNIATECQFYKDINLEHDMIYCTHKSSREICAPKTASEYTPCINFLYTSDFKLLNDIDYINCRNLPQNLICAKPLCKNEKKNDQLWNNNTKNKIKC